MKKNLLVFIVLAINVFLGIYALLTNSFERDNTIRTENTKLYNQIVKFIKSSDSDYKVLSGRTGGTFTFEIEIRNEMNEESMVDFLEKLNFKKVSSSIIILCKNTKNIVLTKNNNKNILEYQRDLLACKD